MEASKCDQFDAGFCKLTIAKSTVFKSYLGLYKFDHIISLMITLSVITSTVYLTTELNNQSL